jgi:hypothetical protein
MGFKLFSLYVGLELSVGRAVVPIHEESKND